MNCPFCDEINFDKPGLWFHLNAYPCDEYNKAGDDYKAFRAAMRESAQKGEKGA